MTMKLEDVLSANLVILGVELLSEQEMLDRFHDQLAVDLRVELGLVTNVASGVTEQRRTLTVGRDRIELTLHASRSTITREYPDSSGLPRLAEIAAQAIELTDSGGNVPEAFGYNMELVFNQDGGGAAIQYIGSKMFSNLLVDGAGKDFVGGAGRMIFSDDAGRWTINVEPRFNDLTTPRVFLNLNLHKQEMRFPGESEILDSLVQMKEFALSFASRLDRLGA